MKTIITAIAAISMIAATSASAFDAKPISTAQQYAEYLVIMCYGNGARLIPIASGSAVPCREIAATHAMQAKKDSTDVQFGTLDYEIWACESSLITDGKMFRSISQQASSTCRTIAACEIKPGHHWDWYHGQGCVDVMAENVIDSSHLGRAAQAAKNEPNYATLEPLR